MIDSIPRRIQIIDSHTGGEPTRCVVNGIPDLGGGTVAERCERFRTEFDALRSGIVREPRGSDVIVGALIGAPERATSIASVIFFNNVSTLQMCGHGTIGVAVTLAHQNRISAGKHTLDTPVGPVDFELHADGHRVTLQNVPSYRYRANVELDVGGYGRIAGDIAWGGNWFFLVNRHQEELNAHRTRELTEFTMAVRRALEANHVTGRDGGLIDHIEVMGDSEAADSRNFVLCPGAAYDRSPCGTGTSAKLACLAADGKLRPGELWRQESIIGSLFEGNYVDNGDGTITPSITGSAWVTAESTLVFDPTDPFRVGMPK